MRALAARGISLTKFYGLTHPSQPNYLASVAGDYFGLNHDEYVEVDAKVFTLVDLLEDADVSWKGYFEGLPGPGYAGVGSTRWEGGGYDYVRKHKYVYLFLNHLPSLFGLHGPAFTFYVIEEVGLIYISIYNRRYPPHLTNATYCSSTALS